MVLTAARCVNGEDAQIDPLSVVAGANNVMDDVNADYPVQIRRATQLRFHPDFDEAVPHVHDVGLMLLDRPLEFNGTI